MGMYRLYKVGNLINSSDLNNRYQVYEAKAQNKAQAEALWNLELSELFEFWGPVRVNGPTTIMSTPERVEELMNFFSSNSIPNRLQIPNVQQ